MKYGFIGFFGGCMAAFTLFIVAPATPGSMSKQEDANYTLGLYMGIPVGFAALVGSLACLALVWG